MVDISRKTYKGSNIETIADSDGIVSLNKKQRRRIIKEKDHKNLQLTTAKYFPDF